MGSNKELHAPLTFNFLSVYGRSYGRNFLFNFDEILYGRSGSKKRELFRWGSKSDDPFPYFAPVFPPLTHFQWEYVSLNF